MSLLAASALAILIPPVGHFQPVGKLGPQLFRQRAEYKLPAYRKVLPSLANLTVNGQVVGTAVLIDASGLYVASKDSIAGREVATLFSNGQSGHATVLSEDGCTQMVLLRSDYVPPGAEPVSLAAETPAGTPVVIILRSGAVNARVISDSRVGLVKPSNRVVPLSEIRLELPEAPLGNAPVFTADGAFVGLLSASLSRPQQGLALGGANVSTSARSSLNQLNLNNQNSLSMGPADLTVAYLPAPDVIRLVIEGFESPSHSVDHPTLGVFCSNGAGGALIQEVVHGSAAEKAELKPGDLITQMGSFMIRSKSDFAKAMFKYRAGSKIVVRVDRSGNPVAREITLGKSLD